MQEVKPIVVKTKAARIKLGDISDSQLYKLIRAGELEIVRIGQATMISMESIDRLIEKSRGAPLRLTNPQLKHQRGRPRKVDAAKGQTWPRNEKAPRREPRRRATSHRVSFCMVVI